MYTTKCCTYTFLYLIQLRALRLNGTTMSSSLDCLACRKGKSKSNLQTNKAGNQKKRIIRSFRVYSILLFYDLKFHGSFKSMLCLWFATVLTTSFNGLFSNFAERRESVMKCSLLHSHFQCHHAMLLPTNDCLESNHIPFPLCLWSNEQTNHV